MLLKLVLISMVILALFAVLSDKLRRVVIYLGIFSFVSSFAYLLYSAPDVAIAEAIIGSTLSTILFLVALKKYSVFTVYYLLSDTPQIGDEHIMQSSSSLLRHINNYCKEQDLEPHLIFSPEDRTNVAQNHAYDLIVEQVGENSIVSGNKENLKIDGLFDLLEKSKDDSITLLREDFD